MRYFPRPRRQPRDEDHLSKQVVNPTCYFSSECTVTAGRLFTAADRQRLVSRSRVGAAVHVDWLDRLKLSLVCFPGHGLAMGSKRL